MTRYPGGIIRATPVVPTQARASGIWTLAEAMQAKAQGIWPVNRTIEHVADDFNGAALTTYTFSGVNFGAEGPTRSIIAAVASRNATMRTVNAITIGGITATFIAARSAASNNRVELWGANVPTGTTGTVEVEWNAVNSSTFLTAFRAANLTSLSPYDTGNSASDPADLSLDMPTAGVGVAVAYEANTASQTWSGVDEFGQHPETLDTFYWAIMRATDAENPRAVSCDYSGTPLGPCAVSASFS